MLVLVLLPMLNDCFNGCACARSLVIGAQIKNYERTFVGVYMSIVAFRRVQGYVLEEEIF
jgi:hypothetical protein